LLDTHGLPVKKATLEKVRKQLAGVSALIDFWWQTVWQDLEHMAMTPKWTQWVEELLLPLIEFIPLSFWYDAPLIARDSDRRHDPWLVYGSPSYSPAQWSSWISRA
jgi:hypothetical protein